MLYFCKCEYPSECTLETIMPMLPSQTKTYPDTKLSYIVRVMTVVVIMLLSQISATSQQRYYSVEGSVTSKSGKPVGYATVILTESLGALTDGDGVFRLPRVKAGDYKVTVSCLGFQTTETPLKVSGDISDLSIVIAESDYTLEDVVVTAKAVAMGSASVINEDAIRHIQPKSLNDILQLVPGSLTSNPSLNSLGQASIREIGTNANNSMGTSVVVDGAPVSNDGNMQALSTSYSGSVSETNSSGLGSQTTAGKGADLRTMSADNIESVEVIRGIPSVEYGNLTSGVVVVKSKTGATPAELKAKVDPFSKMIYAGKGFGLNNGDAINAGVDWAQSYSDTRKHYLGYERVTAQLGYSHVFSPEYRPASFNVRGSFYSNINNSKTDPQMLQGETFKNTNYGGRLGISGNWTLNSKIITAIDYNISASLSHQQDIKHEFIYSPNGVVTNVREPGVNQGVFKTEQYYADYTIDGQPYNLFAQLKANKLVQFGRDNFNNLKVGIEYRLDGNTGRGLVYSLDNPPQSSGGQSLRPRSLSDIPALNNLVLFVEDRLKVDAGTTSFIVQAGVRMTNMFLNREKSDRGDIFMAEPRFNVQYKILNPANNSVFSDLSLTGGWGISYKAPTLLYLYPDVAYFDMVGLSRKSSTEGGSMAIVQTDVVSDTRNPNLTPSKSVKFEGGINFAAGRINGLVTYFNERHYNEFGFTAEPYFMKFNRYTVTNGASDLHLDTDGTLTYKDAAGNLTTATTTADTTICTYYVPTNNSQTKKYGIEYQLDFGQIRPIRTSIIVDGAWYHIERTSTKSYYSTLTDSNYPYIRVMPGGSGTISNRVNTNFRFVTHIPKIRLIFSTTIQVVWYESIQRVWNSGGNPVYYLSDDGSRYCVAPEGYLDYNGDYHTWNAANSSDKQLNRMVTTYLSTSFDREVFSPWVMFNFRLTKQIGSMLELSFTANNFTNSSKWHHYTKYTTGYKQLYPDMYFGAEITLKINSKRK